MRCCVNCGCTEDDEILYSVDQSGNGIWFCEGCFEQEVGGLEDYSDEVISTGDLVDDSGFDIDPEDEEFMYDDDYIEKIRARAEDEEW